MQLQTVLASTVLTISCLSGFSSAACNGRSYYFQPGSKVGAIYCGYCTDICKGPPSSTFRNDKRYRYLPNAGYPGDMVDLGVDSVHCGPGGRTNCPFAGTLAG